MNSRTDVEPIDLSFSGCRVQALSHVGSVRTENQDFMGVFSKGDRVLFVVADGMGGHSGGYEASRMAVQCMSEYFESHFEDDPREIIRHAIVRAHTEIYRHSRENPKMEGMGTTVVAIVYDGSQIWLGHVGDSRAHFLREKEVVQLSIDHTAVNVLAYQGDLDPEAIDNHPYGHILDRSLGGEPDIDIEIQPDPIPVSAGDRILLSSDGFWQYASDTEMLEILTGEDIYKCLKDGIEHALNKGGSDNITLGLLEVQAGVEAAVPVDARIEFLKTANEAFADKSNRKRRPEKFTPTKPAGSKSPVMIIAALVFAVVILLVYLQLTGE